MNRSQVNAVAEEIYWLCAQGKSSFKTSGKSCQVFYRKIARWHLAKISRMRPPLKESVRKKLLKQIEDIERIGYETQKREQSR